MRARTRTGWRRPLVTTADLFTEVSAELAARRGLSTGIDDPPAVRRPLDAALAEAPGPS